MARRLVIIGGNAAGARRAVVAGAGYIGLEVAEGLLGRGQGRIKDLTPMKMHVATWAQAPSGQDGGREVPRRSVVRAPAN